VVLVDGCNRLDTSWLCSNECFSPASPLQSATVRLIVVLLGLHSLPQYLYIQPQILRSCNKRGREDTPTYAWLMQDWLFSTFSPTHLSRSAAAQGKPSSPNPQCFRRNQLSATANPN
jgi:hypothetical protein